MDSQVVNWCKEMLGFPASASGTLVSGGSMANIIGLTVARNTKAGIDVREHGVAAIEKPLRFYGSDQIHSCHRKAMEALGLGNRALRRIPTDASLRIDIPALRAAIAEDRAAGFKPACVIGNAGTVNTGAIDDLRALAKLAHEEDLWFHVDGCIGALIAIAPENAHRVAGIEWADSVALDPHKWLHAPFEVGCALVRDAIAHRRTFAVTPEYLESTPRGLASGEWLHDYGLQTSRGFRALKVWMALKEHGVDKFGRLIDQNIAPGRLSRRDDRGRAVAGTGDAADHQHRLLALVPEGRRLFPGLTVEENLLVARASGRPGPWTVEKVLEAFPILAPLRRSRAASLSGGEQQATAIGRALMTNPRLLLLDEVSLGLAPIAVDAVYRSLEGLLGGGATLRAGRAGPRPRDARRRPRLLHARGPHRAQGGAGELTREQITEAYFGLRSRAQEPQA